MLIALVTVYKLQLLLKVRLDGFTIAARRLRFVIQDRIIKQNRPGLAGQVIELMAYPEDNASV